MTEAEFQRQARLYLGQQDNLVVWRNNVGSFWQLKTGELDALIRLLERSPGLRSLHPNYVWQPRLATVLRSPITESERLTGQLVTERAPPGNRPARRA